MKKLNPMNSGNNKVVKSKINRTNKSWTPEEEQQAWEYYKKGYSFKGIASIMGRTFNGVSSKIMELRQEKKKRYDVVFHDDYTDDGKGFCETLEYCKNYIKTNNGTNNSYFADYKGGCVNIEEVKTSKVVYSEVVR